MSEATSPKNNGELILNNNDGSHIFPELPSDEVCEDVLVPRDSVHQSAMRILPPREKDRQVIGIDRLPRIITLPGAARILRVEYPLSLQEKLTNTLYHHESVKKISSLPPLRCPQDRFGMMQVIVTDPLALKDLIAITSDEMSIKTALSHENTPVILVNGCTYPLYFDFVDDPHNLCHTFSDMPTTSKNTELLPTVSQYPSEMVENKVRLGPCSYLAMNINIFSEEEMAKRVLDHLAVITQSKDFVVNFDQMGNMVLLALQERSAGRLLLWASGLKKLTGLKAHMLFGKGNIVQADEHNLVIDNYLTTRGNTFFQALGTEKSDLYSTDYYLGKMKGTRDQTLARIEIKEKRKGFIAINVIKKVDFAAGGGPDRLIGYKNELAKTKSALNPTNRCKLIFIEGSAGTGKSRLVHEVTDEQPNTVKISIDPAGRNITGFSLVDFAAQLGEDIKTHYKKNQQAIPLPLSLLFNFNDQSENSKLLDANRSPEIICIYCQEALEFLEKEIGAFTIVVDDIHHNDRFSDGYIMELLQDFLIKENTYSKAIMLRRPEARYASAAQENLKISIGNVPTVTLHEEDGRPKLDFTDRAIAEEYVLYSLPEAIRTNPETGKLRMIGDWVSELGSRCKTPFEMTSYLQEIVSRQSEYLIVDKEKIELTTKGHERMHKSLGQEIIIYHLERIREQLSNESLIVLQTFSLLGFKNAFREYLEKFMKQAFDYPVKKTNRILKELQDKGYIIAERKFLYSGENDDNMEPITSYRIWHENLRDIVLKYTMDDNEREEISTKIYKAAAELKLVSDDQIFSIMHYAANNKDINERDFWTDYMNYGNKTLQYTNKNKLHARGYNVATMILDELQSEEKTSPEKPSTMVKALTDLTYGEELPEGFQEFILDTIKAIAHHGYYLGEMEKVHEAISVMEKIQEQFPKQKFGMTEFYEIGYDAAYFQSDKTQLLEYFKKMQQSGIDYAKLMIFYLRTAYSHRQTPECIRIIDSYGKEELPLEVERLKYRIELQAVYNELVASGIDGDSAYSGLDLTPDQTMRVWQVRTAMINFRKKFAAASKEEANTKKRNHPIMELSLLDIEGDAAAYLGIYSHAIKCFSEIWRLAMQMEIPRQALFAAKRKGDLEIMQAVILKHAGKKDDSQKFLKSAIYTYSEEGQNIAIKMTDKIWINLFHIQRLRAISMYLEAADGYDWEDCEKNQEVEKIIDMGLADINALEISEGAKNLPGEFFDKDRDINDFEDCYYVTPYVSFFRKYCEELGYEFVLPKEPYKFESAGCVLAGRHYAKQFKEDKMGERARKIRGLESAKKYYWTEEV
jgi:hypothetical protein